MIIPGIVALLLSILERLAKFRFRASPFLRRYFVSDVIYLLTGFLAGGAMAAAYIDRASGWIGDHVALPRLAEFDLPLWLSTALAIVALDFGNYFAHYLLHRSSLHGFASSSKISPRQLACFLMSAVFIRFQGRI